MNKKTAKRIISVLLAALTVLSLGVCASAASSDIISIEKIEFNNPDFIRGMDVSSVISLENAGVRFYDKNGAEEDIFKILSKNGVNYIRVRVWNDPYDSSGNGYGGGNSDVSKAAQIGARAARHGMKLLVDFHYSDFWADPSKQKAPKAWESYTLEQKQTAVYDFTLDSLTTIKNAGAEIGMVQIGNETNNGIAGEAGNYANMAALFNSASNAVRSFDSDALIAVHFTNPERTDTVKWYADYLNQYSVDYDVFAVSYYPYWHGSLSNLTEVLNYAANKYEKYAMVAETSYANTIDDTDGHGNTVSEWNNNTGDNLLWSFSCQGQAEEVRAVMNAVNEVQNGRGLGVFYWEGAWISVGDVTGLSGNAYTRMWQHNSALWESCGCGWASSYSGDYDPNDAGSYFGGSAVDNQAFFDASGKALPSLKVFKSVCTGIDEDTVKIGDVNQDGSVNVNDVTAVQKYVAKLTALDDYSAIAADANRDGVINIIDATTIQKYVAGLIESF